MALAHHLIAIVYNVLKRGEEYVEIGGDFYDRRNKSKTVSRMVARLERLGYEVTLTPGNAGTYMHPELDMMLGRSWSELV